MAGNRWKNLDFEPPSRRGEGETGRQGEGATARTGNRGAEGGARRPEQLGPSKGAVSRAPECLNADLPPEVTQAVGAYLLRNYSAVVALLEARLEDEPALPGGQRTLGLALARLNRAPEAVDRLRAAVRQCPSDWLARASLASLLLRSDGEETVPPRHRGAADEDVTTRSSGPQAKRSSAAESAEHLQAALGAAPRPALRELLGAARWRLGQEALRAGEYREAGRAFAAATAEFTGAAEVSGAARQALPVRQSSAFIGQAVALLLAGELEAAQALFARSPLQGAAAGHPLGRFAAGLFELCEELARAPVAERIEAAVSLRDMVLNVRLAVGFYDGRQAVSLAWAGGPP
jgi:tetratricopeptide (TPR) repeat protein